MSCWSIIKKLIHTITASNKLINFEDNKIEVGFLMERVIGIEPTLTAWKAAVLPLNYTRVLVPEAGLEPARYFYPRILSPVRLPFRHSGLVIRPRLELGTLWLKVKCSTTELADHDEGFLKNPNNVIGWDGWDRTIAW